MSRLDNYLPTEINHNRFSHPFSGTHSWGIDLDDGSSHYRITNNLTIGCSIKLREGFFRTVENNICVSPHPLAKHVCYKNNGDIIRKNIFYNNSNSLLWEGISFLPKETGQWDHNLYFTVSGRGKISCKGRVPKGFKDSLDFSQWQYSGMDSHSIFGDPLFQNLAEGDFQLHKDSPAHKLGFIPFPTREREFGVRKKAFLDILQNHCQQVSIKSIHKEGKMREEKKVQFLGATIKNLVGAAEMSAKAVGEERGVLFLEIPTTSRAASMGFLIGDLLLQWDDDPVDSVEELDHLLRRDGGKSVEVLIDGNKPARTMVIKIPPLSI